MSIYISRWKSSTLKDLDTPHHHLLFIAEADAGTINILIKPMNSKRPENP
jgi:hypothetical protein